MHLFRESEIANTKIEVRRTGEAKIYEDYNNIEELMDVLFNELKGNLMTVCILVL